MSELPPLIVAFLLFPRVTQLDLTGPAQVLSKWGNTTVHLVAKSREPVQKDSGFAILPTGTFEDVQAANILCVPGGFGDQDPMEDDATLEWLRALVNMPTGSQVSALVRWSWERPACFAVTVRPLIGPPILTLPVSVQYRSRNVWCSIATGLPVVA